jgi:hypothetical protein
MAPSSSSESRHQVHSSAMEQTSKPGTEADLCIVMYGGGVTSYEASRRAIEIFGRENTEIWFADTLTEDRDLYRFNRDVEELLGIGITRFDQGKDIWQVFFEQRALGNSRMDPCSKFLKRKPLREELDSRFCNWRCTVCDTHLADKPLDIRVVSNTGKWEHLAGCQNCADHDSSYSALLDEYEALRQSSSLDSDEARSLISRIDDRLEPADREGRTVRVVLGMDKIDDCRRSIRAELSFLPFRVWFPLDDPRWGVAFKERIMEDLRNQGVRPPRLYELGFKHNNCGGFCVKAGLGQIAHFYRVKPEEYAEHERREQEFRDFVGRDVSIFSRTVEGRKTPMTMRALRRRIEAGEEFKFEPSLECQCFSPTEAVQ